MARFPDTRRDLDNAGYKYLSTAACKGCGATIEWWQTTNKKRIPMNPVPKDRDAIASTHWSTCTARDSFKATPAAKPAPADPRSDLKCRVNELRLELDCAIVVAIYPNAGGVAMADWQSGLSSEELRNALIAAGNQLRHQVQQGGR